MGGLFGDDDDDFGGSIPYSVPAPKAAAAAVTMSKKIDVPEQIDF